MPPDDKNIAWHSMPPDDKEIAWHSMPPDDKEITWHSMPPDDIKLHGIQCHLMTKKCMAFNAT
jgi:hypothetical protein